MWNYIKTFCYYLIGGLGAELGTCYCNYCKCTGRVQLMYFNLPPQSSVEYLYGTKEKVKDLGATWDPFYSMWKAPEDVDVPDELTRYLMEI